DQPNFGLRIVGQFLFEAILLHQSMRFSADQVDQTERKFFREDRQINVLKPTPRGQQWRVFVWQQGTQDRNVVGRAYGRHQLVKLHVNSPAVVVPIGACVAEFQRFGRFVGVRGRNPDRANIGSGE